MWDKLSPGDIERARQTLRLARDELMKRHDDELSGLDRERHDLELLNRLAADFARKFAPSAAEMPTTAPEEPAPAEAAPPPTPSAPEPAPQAGPPAPEPLPPHRPHRPRHPDDAHDHGQSNFAVFNRALSKELSGAGRHPG